MRAFLQGFLFALAQKEFLTTDALRQPVKVDLVAVDGDLLPYFTLTLASGHTYRVEVSVA